MFARGGACYRCSNASKLVDTDCHIEGEGFLALCSGCVHDLAEAAGIVDNRGAIREAKDRASAAEARAFEAEALAARIQAAFQKPRKPSGGRAY